MPMNKSSKIKENYVLSKFYDTQKMYLWCCLKKKMDKSSYRLHPYIHTAYLIKKSDICNTNKHDNLNLKNSKTLITLPKHFS
jgi:hypothetical protein